MGSYDDMLKKSSLDSLTKKITQLSEKQSYTDDRFWNLERDKTGNAEAVIRFLPPTQGEDSPCVQYHSHSFQGPGGWYIENCPTTIGRKCPLCVANNKLWADGTEESQAIVRSRKRKLHYVSNILVVEDTNNPANNGKVFLFRYGKKIYEKIINKMSPKSSRETPINAFHPIEGANFILRIKTVGTGKDKFPNYEDSTFESPSPIASSKPEIEQIWSKQYKLSEFVDASKFKEYDVLEERLNTVLNATSSAKKTVAASASKPAVAPPATKSTPPWEQSAVTLKPPAADEDDADAVLSRLMNEDE